MSQPPQFWLWIDNEARGPYPMNEMWRMGNRKEITRDTLFWSENQQEWRPLYCILDDLEPSAEKLAKFKAKGSTTVRFIGSGTGYECPTCKQMEGQTFPIELAPAFPIPECTCNPWPRCTWVEAEPPEKTAETAGH